MSDMKAIESMRRFSADIRIWTLRTLASAGFGHIGGSASLADVLAVLYGGVMNVDPEDPKKEDRDWFVLSKGHCAPALYATLALKGFIPMDWLNTLNKGGTNLPSHADRLKVPGIDMSTGSLGQGLSNAVGIALANRLQGRDSWTYCVCGDGECNEGQIWEAAQTANQKKLDHLIVFVDWNKKQLDGTVKDINDPVDLEAKFRSFGFDAVTVKGYDVSEIYDAIEDAKAKPGRPHCIVLDTFKGLGVDFAEEAEFNHYLTFDSKEAERSIGVIEERFAEGNYPGGNVTW